MSKAKLAAAREYVKEERYDMARDILTSLGDDPTARKWLSKLDKLAPSGSVTSPPPRPRKRPSPLLRFVLVICVSVIGIGLWIWTYQHPTPLNAAGALVVSIMALGLQQRTGKRRQKKSERKTRQRRSPNSYIRAEPGEYKNINFRSQLEIRLATELDARGIRWEYEKERLGKGRYLVDFYLPDYRCWVEVKGKFDARDQALLPEVAYWLRDKRHETLYLYMSDHRAYTIRGTDFQRMNHDEFWRRLGAPEPQLAIQ